MDFPEELEQIHLFAVLKYQLATGLEEIEEKKAARAAEEEAEAEAEAEEKDRGTGGGIRVPEG